ncbi:Amiloride-sensitive sodium channel [Popillia japonica]|uniref:Amiloride-sensitive sodium channel n=1 Tax=Popillia japonica TaxID=7064 RepID=A0AAW1L7E1_POPJA
MLSFRNISAKRFAKLLPVVENAGVHWSACVPDSCDYQDVLHHFSRNIKLIAEGLKIDVTLDELDCSSIKEAPILTAKHYIVLSLLLGIIGLNIVCALTDMLFGGKSYVKKSILVDVFSSYRNAKYIFNYYTDDPLNLRCLDGIRFLSMAYVVFGHSFLMMLFAPSVNSLELMEWLLQYSSTIIIGGTVSVDSFFMMAGILVAYYTLDSLTANNGKFNWFMFMLYRFVRLTPSYAVVVLTYATLIQFSGSGPLWRKTVLALQKPCQDFWWSALLNMQNYVNPKAICVTQTWYLTCDFFYYMLSPLLTYPLWKWKILGWFNLFIVYVASVLINFYLAWKNQYGAGMLVANELLHTDYFAYHYIAPHVRSSTYILGIVLGGLLHKTKDIKFKLHPVTVTAGWMWSLSLIAVTILGNHSFQLENHTAGWMWSLSLIAVTILGNHSFQLENHDYNRFEESFYLAMSRSSWTVGLMWIVWACKHGYGGAVNILLSHPIFQVLAKVTYSIYLWHLLMQFLMVGALKMPTYFSDFNMMYRFLGEFALIITFSIFYTILFECPGVRLIKHIKRTSGTVNRGSVYGALLLSSSTLLRYQENPTVISMERNRFAWNTSFPCATICPDAKISEVLLDEYITKSSARNKTKLKEFLMSLAQATYSTFDKVVPYDDISSDDYLSILLQLQFEFSPTVSNSAVNARQYFLQKAITENGICYSFNSQLAVYNSPDYWRENNWKLVDKSPEFFINPLDGEVFANVVNMSTGFLVYLHGPYEVGDIASKSRRSPNGYFLQLYITALTLYSNERVRRLSVAQRKCRFYDESNLKRSPVYSYVLCRMECRASLAQKLCGCIPHFYRRIDGDRICNVSGLHCLAQYKEKLISLRKQCSCYPNCEESNYFLEHVDTRQWFLGSNLQWGLKEYPRMRLKRDVIFGFSDLLVYIGGMAGLFLGCSVLSFIEILYFFTLRLFWYSLGYK